MPITVVFLAAGLSTRYRRPKQLEPVGPSGQSVLDYGIFDALRAGAHRIVIVVREPSRQELEDHLETVFGRIPGSFAMQQSGEGHSAGTGVAVLAAAGSVNGPIAVANADDYYGPGAWRSVLSHLDRVPPAEAHCVVGYPLAETLSSSGGVSRAICREDDDGLVRKIHEWQNIIRVGDHLEGTDLAGGRATLDPAARVSMNLWGFTPAFLSLLRRQFERFERGGAARRGDEFLLSEAVNEQLDAGEATVRLLAAQESWFGLTHPADHATVKARLEALTAEGTYPARFHLHHPE